MTNPNNIVRVRARNGGRSSVYEANAAVQPFSQGLLSGNGVLQNTSANMNVLVGGSSTAPDILIAENPAGYKVILDVVGQQSVAITAPASNSRISSVVAYTDDLALSSTETNITGSPSTCGLIVVNGDSASSPVAPDDTAIRAAITADGATGSQASYVVIATIRVSSTTTTITNSLITIQKAGIGSDNVDLATLPFLKRVFYGASGVTGTSGAITFSPKSLDGCWLLVSAKSPSDTSVDRNYGAVIAFIRAGGRVIEALNGAYTGALATSVNNNAITVSGLPTYARCVVYELYMV